MNTLVHMEFKGIMIEQRSEVEYIEFNAMEEEANNEAQSNSFDDKNEIKIIKAEKHPRTEVEYI